MNYADLFRVTLPETALEVVALVVLIVDLGFLRKAALKVRLAVAALLGVEKVAHFDDLVAALQSNSIQCAAQIVDGSLGAGCGVHVCSPSGMNLTGNGQFVEKDLVLRQHGRHGLRRDAAGLRHLVAAFLEGRGSGKVADPVVGISRHERVRER